MGRSESKYYNTALLMDQALALLLDKKDFEYITIKEICAKAGVNRSTFYLHYQNTSDLLQECVDYLNKEFVDSFTTNAHVDLTSPELKDLILVDNLYLLPYLTFIKEHKSFFKAVYKQPAVFQANQKFSSISKDVFTPIFERFKIDKNDYEYMIEYYIKGMTAIIMKWANNGCKEDIEHIANLIISCVRPELEKYEE